MKGRGKLLLTCSALALMTGPMVPEARAADPVQPVAAGMPWWFHGQIDFGGRFFVNNPEKSGSFFLQQNSLAKYYEYSSIKPGPFADFWLSSGSRDGLYQVDAGGKNVGYSDQSYYLDLSKAGLWYLSGIWDQTPHVYSTSAQTLYSGVGSNNLTLAPGLAASLAAAALGAPRQAIIDANVRQTDIGIRRDTAAVEYRWTPTDAWDVRADYSHLRRTGTQVLGMIFSDSSSGEKAELPAPVNDSTQNFGVNGEYLGTSPWGKKYTVKLAYNGSVYQGNTSFDADNPFPPVGVGPFTGRMSGDPDNNANMFTGTIGADLPWNSRYMGTVSYNMMRQNDPYLPFTSNPNPAFVINGQPANSIAALPFKSLDGKVDTLLFNNVLTTQLTSDLKSKLQYRYYSYDNGSQEQFFGTWVSNDFSVNSTDQKRSISLSYTKQNGLAELTWMPWREMTLGAQAGVEKYTWWHNDADETTEVLGKVYLVHKVNGWMTTRGSWQYSERRYDNYTNQVQMSLQRDWNEHYRDPKLANRDQNLAKAQVDIVLMPTVMVSPFGGLKLQDYQTDAFGPARELGILKDHSWNAGAELLWTPTRQTQFMFSYTYDESDKRLVGGGGTTGLATNTWDSTILDKTHTFTAALKQNLIEDKLDLKLAYVYSVTDGQWTTVPFFYNGFVFDPAGAFPIYPDTRSSFHRLDALATYKFDQSVVRQMGWNGEALLKLRYAWERYGVSNWQSQFMQPYMFPFSPSSGSMIWLGWDNPNYDVHMLGAALALRW